MAKKKAAFVETLTEDDDLPEESIDETITDNALAVPLFADIDGRTSRSISQLKLSKLESGGIAYKGMIPLSSTLDTIGQIFGDGIYTLEGLNHRGTTLHIKENIRIALGNANQDSGKDLVRSQSMEPDRIERLARQSAAESMENNRAFLQLVIQTENTRAERDRQFFTSLMAMQDRQYQQTIAMMTTTHNATLQTMQASRENQPDRSNDSRELLETLIRGMTMGRELGGGPEPAPMWQNILQGGLGALAQVQQQSAALPAGESGTPNPRKPKRKGLSTAHKRTLLEAVKLHKAVRSSGVDPTDLIAQLSKAGESAPLEAAPTLSDRMHAERSTPQPEDPDTDSDDDSDDVLDDDSDDDDLDDDVDEDESDPNESAHAASAGSAD